MSNDNSLGNAFEKLLKKSPWGSRFEALNIQEDWEAIVGKTISRHTDKLLLQNGTLRVYTTIAPLRQELILQKRELIQKINLYYERVVVNELIVA